VLNLITQLFKIIKMDATNIKFRFWVHSQARMIYALGFCRESESMIRIWYRKGEGVVNESFKSEDLHPMQFTGYLDVKSNEIYVGDIMGQGLLTFKVVCASNGEYSLKHTTNAKFGNLGIGEAIVQNSFVSGNIFEI